MEEKKHITEPFLLELKRGESKAIRLVYEQSYPACAALVLNNNGSTEDAKDLFQEAIIVLIEKLKDKDFQLTASIKTYLYAVVRNLWLKKLRNDEKKGLQLIVDEPNINFQVFEEEHLSRKEEEETQHKMVEAAFSTMNEDCKKIITAFYYLKQSLGDIAEQLGYSDNFIKVKKKRCMDALKEKVFNKQPKNQ